MIHRWRWHARPQRQHVLRWKHTQGEPLVERNYLSLKVKYILG